MLCSKYQNLTIPERTVKIGELIHALQNDDECFTALMDIVHDAKLRGVFDGVKINPNTHNQ